jgi:hypothetical protein
MVVLRCGKQWDYLLKPIWHLADAAVDATLQHLLIAPAVILLMKKAVHVVIHQMLKREDVAVKIYNFGFENLRIRLSILKISN